MNANGLASEKKVEMFKAQLRHTLEQSGTLARLELLEFQWVDRPEPNPSSQLASTSYIRVFAEARDDAAIQQLIPAWAERVRLPHDCINTRSVHVDNNRRACNVFPVGIAHGTSVPRSRRPL